MHDDSMHASKIERPTHAAIKGLYAKHAGSRPIVAVVES